MEGFSKTRSQRARRAAVRPEGPKVGMEFLGRGNKPPPHQLWDLESDVSSPAGSGVKPRPPTVPYILSAPHTISCCILGAFCTRKLYTMQRGKRSDRFLEAMWNSHCRIHYMWSRQRWFMTSVMSRHNDNSAAETDDEDVSRLQREGCERQRRLLWKFLRVSLSVPPFTRALLNFFHVFSLFE